MNRSIVTLVVMGAIFAVVAVLLVTCSGCAGLSGGSVATPRDQYALAYDAYATTLEVLCDVREAGEMSDATYLAIEPVRIVAAHALAAWRAALDSGTDPTPWVIETWGALVELGAFRATYGEGGE